MGLKIINSQFVGGGYGLATNESKTFSPRELVCQYFGRFLVLTKSQTDELFNPIFFGNHERLILLTFTMQPIVHHHQTKPDTYDQVSFFFVDCWTVVHFKGTCSVFWFFIKVEPDQPFVYHLSSKACATGYANTSAGAKEAIDQDGNTYTLTMEARKQMVNAK